MTHSRPDQKPSCPDQWSIREEDFDRGNPLLSETLFSLANGYIGTRGTQEEGGEGLEGTYLNGVYMREEIPYGERAAGFATHNHKMVSLPNGKFVRIFLDTEEFHPDAGKTMHHSQKLDMRQGVLYRTVEWSSPSGKKIRFESRRFVSLADQNLCVMQITVTPLNFYGTMKILSGLDGTDGTQLNTDDPRVGTLTLDQGLHLLESQNDTGKGYFRHSTVGSHSEICSAFQEYLSAPGDVVQEKLTEPGWIGTRYHCAAVENHPVTLTKYLAYCHKETSEETDLAAFATHCLANAAATGFSGLLNQHAQILDHFWQQADITIEGEPSLQQGMRFNLFHIFQSAGRNGTSNIAAKGLTGPGYEGHYFWDTEIYIIPSLLFTMPEMVERLLHYRHRILPAARARAREMGHSSGALYPWRTIGGEECSAFFPASTAQYHINSAIAYAIDQYYEVTEDWAFIVNYGAEIIFETARIWPGLGHYSSKHQGQFCLYEVTGPDEYTAMVDNNFYTNAMAQRHLEIAVKIAAEMRTRAPAPFRTLCDKIGLADDEISQWAEMAAKMFLPYDPTLQINPQDDSFLDKPTWDFAHVPQENYPLLLHYHPLVIYRHQVLKQADVILAMFLLGDRFSLDQKRHNLEYYEPRTTHDSTLSSCIHSIICTEVGEDAAAYDFFQDAVRMDLDNHHQNSEYGVHTAAMAGSWMAVVNGFAGMRLQDNGITFAPTLPPAWTGYSFSVRFKGRKINLNMTENQVTYKLTEGADLHIRHEKEVIMLKKGQPLTRALLPRPGRPQ